MAAIRTQLLISVLLTTLLVNVGQSDIVMFDVDLQATSEDGSLFRVYGQLTVDPFVALTSENVVGSMFFQQDDQTPIALPSLSVGGGGTSETQTFKWNLVGDNLYWTYNEDVGFFSDQALIFASADMNVQFWMSAFYFPSSSQGSSTAFARTLNSTSDTALFGRSSSRPGVLIGTRSVPEPTSTCLLSLIGLMACVRIRGR